MSKGFWIGLTLGVIATGSVGFWLLDRAGERPTRFASKGYVDGEVLALFQGSIYGEGENAPVNNYIHGRCQRDTMQCEIQTISEFTPGTLSPMLEDRLKISKWDDREIIADSKGTDPGQCNYYEVKIDRRTEEIEYLRIPLNPVGKSCEPLLDKVMRWRIDNGKAWGQNADGTSRQ